MIQGKKKEGGHSQQRSLPGVPTLRGEIPVVVKYGYSTRSKRRHGWNGNWEGRQRLCREDYFECLLMGCETIESFL